MAGYDILNTGFWATGYFQYYSKNGNVTENNSCDLNPATYLMCVQDMDTLLPKLQLSLLLALEEAQKCRVIASARKASVTNH